MTTNVDYNDSWLSLLVVLILGILIGALIAAIALGTSHNNTKIEACQVTHVNGQSYYNHCVYVKHKG